MGNLNNELGVTQLEKKNQEKDDLLPPLKNLWGGTLSMYLLIYAIVT